MYVTGLLSTNAYFKCVTLKQLSTLPLFAAELRGG
jgi:hypothetical protein